MVILLTFLEIIWYNNDMRILIAIPMPMHNNIIYIIKGKYYWVITQLKVHIPMF